MKRYNYKCVTTKNGNKMYYKQVKGNWKRISNKDGEKAERGKRTYRIDWSWKKSKIAPVSPEQFQQAVEDEKDREYMKELNRQMAKELDELDY